MRIIYLNNKKKRKRKGSCYKKLSRFLLDFRIDLRFIVYRLRQDIEVFKIMEEEYRISRIDARTILSRFYQMKANRNKWKEQINNTFLTYKNKFQLSIVLPEIIENLKVIEKDVAGTDKKLVKKTMNILKDCFGAWLYLSNQPKDIII